jgi:hypothetical protein
VGSKGGIVNDPPPRIESLLASPPHVDDAGFTDRVMSAIPRRRRASRAVYALVPLATALGGAIAVFTCGPALAAAPLFVMIGTWVIASSLVAA